MHRQINRAFVLLTYLLPAFSNSSFGDFDKNISTNLPPISVDKDFPIFSQNISCAQVVNAGIKIDLDAKVDAQVTIGVVAQGSLIPPSVTEFAMFAGVHTIYTNVLSAMVTHTFFHISAVCRCGWKTKYWC